MLKYGFAAAVVLLVAAAVIAYLEREALAEKIANSILAGSDVTVASLAIRSLDAAGIDFAKLTLVLGNSDRVELRDVYLPLDLPQTRISSVTIRELKFIPGPGPDTPLDITGFIDLYAGLPGEMPGVTVDVARLLLPDIPPIRDLHWQSAVDSEQLALTVMDVHVAARLQVQSAGKLSLLAHAGKTQSDEVELNLEFERQANAYRANGNVTVRISPWLDILRSAGMLPEGEIQLQGTLQGPLELQIETVAEGEIAASVTLVATDRKLGFKSADGAFGVDSAGAEKYQLSFIYPSFEWTLDAGPFVALLAMKDTNTITVSVNDLSCVSGIRCTLAASANADELSYDDANARQLNLAGNIEVQLDDSWAVSWSPTAASVAAVQAADWSLGGMQLQGSENLRILASADGVRASAGLVSLAINSLRIAEQVSATASLQLRKLSANSDGLQFDTSFEIPTAGTSIAWQGNGVVAPGIKGTAKLGGARGDISIEVLDPAAAMNATINLAHRPGFLSASIARAHFDFGLGALSGRLKRWPYEWDIVAGELDAKGHFEWRNAGLESAKLDLSFIDLAGKYEEIGASGISGSAPLRAEPGGVFYMGPADVRVALLDIGIPLTDLTATASWDSATNSADIDSLQLSLLGGKARLAPFRYALDTQSAAATLHLESVQLALIAELADFDDIGISGAISGQIPLTLHGTTITVSGGTLASDAPGGVIRYHAGADSADTSGLGLATRALSNMQYETLTSKVNYTTDGDLLLQMRLKGINPDYDPLQPVILNLGVENNIPELLRSLQATRDIEKIIESRSAK
ncbi:MAG TPA: YdbH domain-containing protein [Woeseiaceae bacterium]|nr:YdbH domain-containing protein [Woeseiaceae bacterium]